MSFARHWEITSLASLCVAAMGLSACSGETGASSAPPVESIGATSAEPKVLSERAGERGEALLGGYQDLSAIKARSPRISSGLHTPSPVLPPNAGAARANLPPEQPLE